MGLSYPTISSTSPARSEERPTMARVVCPDLVPIATVSSPRATPTCSNAVRSSRSTTPAPAAIPSTAAVSRSADTMPVRDTTPRNCNRHPQSSCGAWIRECWAPCTGEGRRQLPDDQSSVPAVEVAEVLFAAAQQSRRRMRQAAHHRRRPLTDDALRHPRRHVQTFSTRAHESRPRIERAGPTLYSTITSTAVATARRRRTSRPPESRFS